MMARRPQLPEIKRNFLKNGAEILVAQASACVLL
jgi:hypothetical protein